MEKGYFMRMVLRFNMIIAIVLILSGPIQLHAAESVQVTGEIVDTYCYALMGAKGPSHRQCAIDCIKKGIPAGLLEEGTNKLYILLPNKDKSPLPEDLIKKVAEKVTIIGKVYTSGGIQFLTVESIK